MSNIINSNYLERTNFNFNNIFFITEDQESTSIIEQVKINATNKSLKSIGLNSIDNVNELITKINDLKNLSTFPLFILCLNNNTAGRDATRKIHDCLNEIATYREANNLSVYPYALFNYERKIHDCVNIVDILKNYGDAYLELKLRKICDDLLILKNKIKLIDNNANITLSEIIQEFKLNDTDIVIDLNNIVTSNTTNTYGSIIQILPIKINTTDNNIISQNEDIVNTFEDKKIHFEENKLNKVEVIEPNIIKEQLIKDGTFIDVTNTIQDNIDEIFNSNNDNVVHIETMNNNTDFSPVLSDYTNIIQDKKTSKPKSYTYTKDGKYHYFTINTYLEEIEDIIFNILDDNKNRKVLIIAPTGAGKSETMNKFTQKRVDKNEVVAMINPAVIQLHQSANQYNIKPICNGGERYIDANGSGVRVGVTPESMHKIEKQRNGQAYTLIFDEAHTLYTKSLFRNLIAEVPQYENNANKVVYLTATGEDIEDIEEFDTIIKVFVKNPPVINLNILICKELKAGTLTTLVRQKSKEVERVFVHQDNKKKNKVLCDQLGENIVIDGKTYNTADYLHSSIKDGLLYDELVKGDKPINIPDHLKTIAFTSCIEAGLNIKQDKLSSVFYVVNENSFYWANVVQTFGRYRDKSKLKDCNLLIKELDKTLKPYKNFDTILEEQRQNAILLIPACNNYRAGGYKDQYEDMEELACLKWNENKNTYEVDEYKLKARAYKEYNKGILYQTNTLVKKLEQQTGIKFNINIIHLDEVEEDKATSDALKVMQEIEEQEFNETIKEMLTLKPEDLEEVMTSYIDQRKPNAEQLENLSMNYHKTASDGFKDFIKQVAKEKDINKAKAFTIVAKEENKADIERDLEQEKAYRINKNLNEMGVPNLIKYSKGHSKQFRLMHYLRYKFKNVEAKHGKITKELINTTIDDMEKKKLFTGRAKDRKKQLKELEYALNLTYYFDNQYRISSVKTSPNPNNTNCFKL